MTTGYTCDRCGETFTGGKWLYGGYHDNSTTMQTWDLCPECMVSFSGWMERGQIADMSGKSADCVRDGDSVSDSRESVREHSLESESVRERPESAGRVTKQAEMSHDTREKLGHVTESPEMSYDTREKLEADVRSYLDYPRDCRAVYDVNAVKGWLDRQASITEREFFETACEGCERLGGDGGATLDELRDELRKYIVKADRLGAALDERDAQLADARESLEAAWEDNAELGDQVDELTKQRDHWKDAFEDSVRLRLELVEELEKRDKGIRRLKQRRGELMEQVRKLQDDAARARREA